MLFPCGIKIHPPYFGLGKKGMQFLFYLFRPEPLGIQGKTSAGLATFLKEHLMATVMAAQLFFELMISKAYIAIGALGGMTTTGTFHYRGIAPSVLEQDYLFPHIQGLHYSIQ